MYGDDFATLAGLASILADIDIDVSGHLTVGELIVGVGTISALRGRAGAPTIGLDTSEVDDTGV
jgi:hypothetical protein